MKNGDMYATFELANPASIVVNSAIFGASEHGMLYLPLPPCHHEAQGSQMPSWLKRLGLHVAESLCLTQHNNSNAQG
jgi:hypothetical protein